MAGDLDEISVAVGEIRADVKNMMLRADEHRRERDKEHEDSRRSIAKLSELLSERARQYAEYQMKFDKQFSDYQIRTESRLVNLELMQPIVAGLQLTKAKMMTLASIGFVVMVSLGWIMEAGLKWLVEQALAHFK